MDLKTQETINPPADTGHSQPEVFFDGGCVLCQAEIGLYRRSGAEVAFCDISGAGAEMPDNKTRAAMLARFHVRRSDGALVSGAAAFAELWKATPGWRWLGHIVATPPLVWMAEAGYRVFLVLRPLIQQLAQRIIRPAP